MDRVMDRFARTKILFGDENFAKLQRSKVLLLGVGGVGGVCLDALYRTGVSDITIVDSDVFEVTNQNRQLGSEKLGMVKVERMKELMPSLTPLHVEVTPEWVSEFDFESFDLVIDAIDDMVAKVAIANKVSHKLISSMGGAKRLDPTQIKNCSVWKTKNDALARKFRYELRQSGFKGDFEVVYSDELPNCTGLGSFMGVTGSFGLNLASLAIRKLLA